ncbi:hypothetical protein NDU88_006233 [Pleurodeles waltl]|uniref:Uncharacterized protein n=1 Tax=Pleurodeles waltl TaxID=8319 RepID=A0AAV7SP64_PLEWA|nr:hypothetical protein NDU88_006233 [Pleurodeles waltl]
MFSASAAVAKKQSYALGMGRLNITGSHSTTGLTAHEMLNQDEEYILPCDYSQCTIALPDTRHDAIRGPCATKSKVRIKIWETKLVDKKKPQSTSKATHMSL